MNAWTVVFYETEGGDRPVPDYLNQLDAKEARKVGRAIQILEAFGLRLGAPHVRNIQGKLWELRITGRRQHRIFYFAATGQRLVLLHAFTKKTPRTPQGEIDTALWRLADLQRRDRP